MALYFIRHAQTPGNAANVWVGRRDEGITAEGEATLHAVAQQLAQIEFSHIFTSPLLRARLTADVIAQSQRKQPIVVVRKELQERDFGSFEGKVKTAEHRHRLEQDASVETLASIGERLQRVLNEVSKIQGYILLVSHSAVFKCLVEQLGFNTTPVRSALDNVEYVQLITPAN